MVETVGESTL